MNDLAHYDSSPRREAIRVRLEEFARVPRSEYFYELGYCLLTPQSSAVNADRVITILKSRQFQRTEFDPTPLLADRAHYIRFHSTKAKRLLWLRNHYEPIEAQIDLHGRENGGGRALRKWLAENVNGLGWKEASHFLRNIGYRDLAILDRHILKNLKAHGVIGRVPASLTPRRYLAMEKKFHRFADGLGIPMDELDIWFWSGETGIILK